MRGDGCGSTPIRRHFTGVLDGLCLLFELTWLWFRSKIQGQEASKSLSLVGATVIDKGAVITIKPKGDKDVDIKVFCCSFVIVV